MSKNNGTKNIWKSIKEYQDDPEILSAKLNEFQEGVTDDFHPEEMSKFSRRKFLAILAASTAYAATACTSYRDKGEIIPYVNRPEEILPGKPTYYASTFSDDGQSYGILIKTREGRPIKIEGNPDDPINMGKIPSKVHSSILNLYDPERLQFPKIDNRKVDWDKINSEIKNLFLNTNGKEIPIFTNPITSPTTIKLLDELKAKYPNIKIYTTQLANNNNRKIAWKKTYNTDIIPSIKWDKAKVIVSLESDFLGKEGNTAENRILYAKARDIANTKTINKLYSVEAGMSLTGMNADERFRLKPQLQFDLVLALIKELISNGTIPSSKLDSNLFSLIAQSSLQDVASKSGLSLDKLKNIVHDLSNNAGKSIIYAGDILPEETHIIVNLLNELLGNTELYNFESAYLNIAELTSAEELNKVINKIKNGEIETVIHFDSNPVYELPLSLNYAESLKNVKNIITLSESPNETTLISNYVLAINNIYESWGDHQTRSNVLTLQQPVITPLFDTLQKETVILNWINDEKQTDESFQEYLKNNVKSSVYSKGNYAADFNTFWVTALHDGVLKVSVINNLKSKLAEINLSKSKNNTDGLTLILTNNYYIGTGKYSNNGWLQELPHPVSKIAWDNYAAISPSTGIELGIENDDLVKIKVDDSEIEIPAFIQPGMADNTVIIELGYGRTNSGEVSNNVGFNANVFLNPKNLSQYIFDNVTLTKTGEVYKLASTQEHHSLDDEFVKDLHLKRNIIQEGTLEEYKNNPKFLKEHRHEIFSINEAHEYKNEKWAMSIDLNKCLGCSECVSSCNVENNIPVVGKDQVARGREMHWIRIDRYYSGTPDEPIVSTQPMLCQHCDNAPCENVCPVNATNHSPDGLNQMAYNRCVGTRYCANNCPYKVRRFNFYNFRDHFADAHYENELTGLVHNPEVTVRSRGVIEKCSFCVQNIMAARENAIREGRSLNADEVKTSCQSACPTDAIVFGDSNNPESTVTKNREHDLSYHVLEELNVKPNVTYLAKIRNTHTEDV
ncbi:MAG: TAT-variant-translocated molybdopterin oxidoreductase [Ignavibacteriales bacterium]|nr:TAT-variant-translocated molybdopterin oxidoreductase [Ignavibacteriales bacterium]